MQRAAGKSLPCNAAEGRYKPPDPASEKEENYI